MEINKNKFVYLTAILYALITGHSFLFTKIALKTAEPVDILAYRFTAAFIGILIPILFGWVKVDYSKGRVKKIIPLSLFYPLLFFGFQTIGLQYATSSEAGILSASSPIFTLILASYFLKEKSSMLQKLSIIVSVLGVVYITAMKGLALNLNNLLGIILLLLSAISISIYNVLVRTLSKGYTNIELSCIMITVSFICYNAISIGKHLANGSLRNYFALLGNTSFLISIIYLGVLSSLITSLSTNYILSKIEASRMSVFSNLGTVITIIAGVIFLKESVYYYHIIGSIFIIGGVVGANYFRED